MTNQQAKRIVVALDTANQWSSDGSLGSGMLTLGTTRKIHDENHRQKCINEIQVNIQQVIKWARDYHKDMNKQLEYTKDIVKLADLWELVAESIPDKEWISYREAQRLSEILHNAGGKF